MFQRNIEAVRADGRAVRSALAISLCLTVLGMALVGYYYTGLKASAEKFRYATSDNVTWTIVQVEVDYQNLRLAIARELAQSGNAAVRTRDTIVADLSGIDATPIKRAFDIYYSRVDASRFIYEGALSGGNGELSDIITRLYQSKEAMAEIIDSWSSPSRADLEQLLAMADASQNDIRQYAIQALQVLVNDAADERNEHLGMLQNYASLLILIVALLLGMLAVSWALQRRLKSKAVITERIAYNLNRIVEASQDAVVIADGSGYIKQYNAAAESIFGYTEAEALGQPVHELLIPEQYQAEYSERLQFLSNGGQGEVVDNGRHIFKVRDKRGREFPAETTIASSKDADDNSLFIGILRDISERIENEEKLHEAVDAAKRDALAKEQFLAVMSHEMRTPLQGVLATFDLLADDEATQDLRDLIGLGKRSGMKALEQVNNTLELARLSDSEKSAQDVSHADALNPQDLVQRLVDLLEPLLLKQGNTISFTSNWPNHLNILANQSLLESVLENLMANANKFTANGRICVDLNGHTDGDDIDLRITITDNGIGIAPEKIHSIFDDFATGDAGYTRTSEGTGLGLGIVKRATEKLGGQIAVQSAPQKGSAFTFSGTFKHVPSGDFTSAGSAITPEINEHRAPQNRSKPHVLVVDDNATNQTLIGRMLERLECSYDFAEDGQEAVDKCAITQFDLILMDLSMPRMNGIEAAQVILGNQVPQGPIVCITAHNGGDTLQQVLDAGMSDYLIKPIRLNNLSQLLDKTVFAGQQGPNTPLPTEPARPEADLDALSELRSTLGADQALSILAQFEQTTKDELAGLRANLGTTSEQHTIATIHSIAGSAAMIGATALHKTLLAAENEPKLIDDTLLAECQSLLGSFCTYARQHFKPTDREAAE